MSDREIEPRELYETLQSVGLIRYEDTFGALDIDVRRKWEAAAEALQFDCPECIERGKSSDCYCDCDACRKCEGDA